MNDSRAGLLNSYDNPGFQEDVDLDTSYENSGSSEVGFNKIFLVIL